jgi:hypothetical protein
MRLTTASAAALLLLAAACSDRTPSGIETPEPPPPTAPRAVGVYQFEITGLGGEDLRSNVEHVPTSFPQGVSAALANAGTGLVFEQVSSSSFTDGPRNQNGQRYVTFTYRVRNGTGVSLNNLTVLLVSKSSTVPGTALSALRKLDGTPAADSIARHVIPTGAVAMGTDLTSMQALYPDVLQVLSEAEAAAVTKPIDVTDVFPVGYVVRSRTSVANRSLPATTDANQFDGVLTLSFRLPLQTTAAQDVFSFFFQILAVTDSETRLTESIEESQDTAAVRRLRERATSLGATMVTVLNGSGRMDPSVTNYPGQRQLCSVRTAGTAASPVTFINRFAAHATYLVLRPGETADPCAPNFKTGAPGRPATNVAFPVTVRAVDRYGNLRTPVDSVEIVLEPGSPPGTLSPRVALTGGTVGMNLTFSDYGNATFRIRGRRLYGAAESLPVAGVTRTWTAGAGTTDWHTHGNWLPAAVPMHLDSVTVPAAPAGGVFPLLAGNVFVAGVTVENAATISIGAFDLTASGNVATGTSGAIGGSTGRVVLTGIARTVQGTLPRVRVLGTYSLDGNLTVRAPLRVESGRLRNASYRIRAVSN